METKRAKVIMLPTNSINQVNKGDLFINDSREYNWGKLEALKCERITSHGHAWNGNGIQAYINHLYITTDDEIKEGDWCIDLNDNNYLFQVTSEFLVDNKNNLKFIKKIIATTDSSLMYLSNNGRIGYNLPQPSQGFIEKYIKEYNKGNIITDIIVEYEEILKCYRCGKTEPNCVNTSKNCIGSFGGFKQLKISKDNTITIHSIKDSWSREEVESLLFNCLNDQFAIEGNKSDIDNFNQWIEENL